MRKLFSKQKQRVCGVGCKYCFSCWGKVDEKVPTLEMSMIDCKSAVVYPCCDGDFFDQDNLFDTMRSIAREMDSVYFSISSKKALKDRDIERLVAFDKELKEEKKGFVKFALSFSCSSDDHIAELEPCSATYIERLETARHVSKTGLQFGVTIKPVLPFISNEEYFRIIDDFAVITDKFVIGGLYIQKDTQFFKDFILGNYQITKRAVEWLPDSPEWDYVEDEGKMRAIYEYAEKRNIKLFDSDYALILSLADMMK